jgi:hypothetical protein
VSGTGTGTETETGTELLKTTKTLGSEMMAPPLDVAMKFCATYE